MSFIRSRGENSICCNSLLYKNKGRVRGRKLSVQDTSILIHFGSPSAESWSYLDAVKSMQALPLVCNRREPSRGPRPNISPTELEVLSLFGLYGCDSWRTRSAQPRRPLTPCTRGDTEPGRSSGGCPRRIAPSSMMTTLSVCFRYFRNIPISQKTSRSTGLSPIRPLCREGPRGPRVPSLAISQHSRTRSFSKWLHTVRPPSPLYPIRLRQ